jgi:hypothetical protein
MRPEEIEKLGSVPVPVAPSLEMLNAGARALDAARLEAHKMPTPGAATAYIVGSVWVTMLLASLKDRSDV